MDNRLAAIAGGFRKISWGIGGRGAGGIAESYEDGEGEKKGGVMDEETKRALANRDKAISDLKATNAYMFNALQASVALSFALAETITSSHSSDSGKAKSAEQEVRNQSKKIDDALEEASRLIWGQDDTSR